MTKKAEDGQVGACRNPHVPSTKQSVHRKLIEKGLGFRLWILTHDDIDRLNYKLFHDFSIWFIKPNYTHFSTLVYLEMSGPKVRTVAEVSKRIFGHVIRAPNTRWVCFRFCFLHYNNSAIQNAVSAWTEWPTSMKRCLVWWWWVRMGWLALWGCRCTQLLKAYRVLVIYFK